MHTDEIIYKLEVNMNISILVLHLLNGHVKSKRSNLWGQIQRGK